LEKHAVPGRLDGLDGCQCRISLHLMHLGHGFRCRNTPGLENDGKLPILIDFYPKNLQDQTKWSFKILKIPEKIVGNLLVINHQKKYRIFSIYSCAPVCFCALS
jgi:hypothetical protein